MELDETMANSNVWMKIRNRFQEVREVQVIQMDFFYITLKQHAEGLLALPITQTKN